MDNTKRQVQFATDTKDGLRSYTPLVKSSGQQRRSDMGETILKIWMRASVEILENSKAGDGALRATLDDFGLTGPKMVTFMGAQGKKLLLFAVSLRKSSEHLRFICDYVPRELLKEVLMRDNHYVLWTFLVGNSEAEKAGRFTARVQEEQVIKVKLLLGIDAEGLESYMRSDVFNREYEPGVRACFEQTVAEYRMAPLPEEFKKMELKNG